MTDVVPGTDAPVLVVANEFADVEIRPTVTRNGIRLEIRSPRRGTVVHLDAVELECLTWQPPDVFSDLLAARPSA
ncbi:MAG: dihydrodiol dehydrogenase [Actinobacteria bacterium]|nr:dihydrodiol dehydrogenase [Actinomycetota bacterium]